MRVLQDTRRGHIREGGIRNIDAKTQGAAPLKDGKDESKREREIVDRLKGRIREPGTDQKGRKEALKRKEQRIGSFAKIAEIRASNSLLMGSDAALDVVFDSDSALGQQQ